jgi:hypothetical protein
MQRNLLVCYQVNVVSFLLNIIQLHMLVISFMLLGAFGRMYDFILESSAKGGRHRESD